MIRPVIVLFIGMVLALGSAPVIGQTEAQDPCGIMVRLSRFMPGYRPMRVLVITTHNQADRLQEQDIFAQAMAASFQRCLSMQCSISHQKMCLEKMPKHCGCFDERFLLAAHKMYGIDAVLYCEVTSLDAYDPARLEAHALLVDVRESVALLEASQTFDLGNPAIDAAYRKYLNGTTDSPMGGLYTPTQFLEFCATSLVAEIGRKWNGRQ